MHVAGVAYKRNIDDMRESPALDIIQLLKKRGAVVSYSDPFVPSLRLDGVDTAVLQPAGIGKERGLRGDRHRSLRLQLPGAAGIGNADRGHPQCHEGIRIG